MGANGAGKSRWTRLHREAFPLVFYDPEVPPGRVGFCADHGVARARHLRAGETFGLETTFTRRWRLGLVREAVSRGYFLEAVFVGTADPVFNVGRVLDRHRAGSGHLVPAATVRRRWIAAQDNLVLLAGAFSTIRIIDSTFDPAVLCAVVSRAALSLRVSAPPAWVAVLVARLCRRAVSTAAGARTP